jgi:hypothetical protein
MRIYSYGNDFFIDRHATTGKMKMRKRSLEITSVMATSLAATMLTFGMSVAKAEDITKSVALLEGAPGSFTAGFSVTHQQAGSFMDTINFMPFDVSGMADGSLITIGFTPQANIDFSSANLNGHAYTFSPNGQLEFGSLDPTSLVGPLVLKVFGASGANASYSSTLNITSPVPEPLSFSLMFAGLGVIGFALRRRKQDGGHPAFIAIR